MKASSLNALRLAEVGQCEVCFCDQHLGERAVRHISLPRSYLMVCRELSRLQEAGSLGWTIEAFETKTSIHYPLASEAADWISIVFER